MAVNKAGTTDKLVEQYLGKSQGFVDQIEAQKAQEIQKVASKATSGAAGAGGADALTNMFDKKEEKTSKKNEKQDRLSERQLNNMRAEELMKKSTTEREKFLEKQRLVAAMENPAAAMSNPAQKMIQSGTG